MNSTYNLQSQRLCSALFAIERMHRVNVQLALLLMASTLNLTVECIWNGRKKKYYPSYELYSYTSSIDDFKTALAL